ncbi:MAG TPA: nitrilase family protein [Arachidicoccus sp.]|nr:nitrilase family protein [Arachidicoccus sp.]
MSSITISTIQTNIFWKNKEANLKMLEEKILSITEPTEIVVLPEMFSTGFTSEPVKLAEPMEGATVNWMRELAAKKNIILTGSIVIQEEEDFYNRLIWMLPNGDIGTYDKRHLFAYGGEAAKYNPGNKRLIASVKGWRINLQICYDLRFPVWARQQIQASQPEYDILINVANWPEKRHGTWTTLLKARAIENMAYVVGVNRVGVDGNKIAYRGDSVILDPLGNPLYEGGDQEDINTITLKKDNLQQIRDQYPFLGDADTFLIK